MRTVLFLAMVGACRLLAQTSPVDGDWGGVLRTGGPELHIVMHVRTDDGKLTAALDSPDQGALGLPASAVSFSAPAFRFEVPNLALSYEGKLEGGKISGTLTQRGHSLPLVFERADTVEQKPHLNEETWSGEAVGPSGNAIRMLMKIWSESDGSRHATIESPGQAVAPIPAAGLVQTADELKFQLRAFSTSYEGKFSAAHASIEGKLTQGGVSVPLVFRHTGGTTDAVKPAVRNAEGIWEGTLLAGATNIRITLKIRKDPSGIFTGTLDSIDTNLSDVPLTDVTFRENTYVHVDIKRMAATYDAKLAEDGASMNGTWTQGTASLSLPLKRVEKATELRRPQMPQPPFPYKAEEVTYANPKAPGVQLSGTLTLPQGSGPFTAALLLTGSGPQDRDESLMGHKPFLVIADYLTRRGIAVLRVDDRGVGKSTGRFNTATTADFAGDAEAGLAFLKSRKEIDSARIGLIGHSEGGLIAPLIASRHPEVAFVVMLAGPGVTGAEVVTGQVGAMVRASGAPAEAVAKAEETQRNIMQVVVEEPDDAKAEERLKAIAGPNPQIKALLTPWYRYFAAYNPRPVLEKVKQPVLALNGDKDVQIVAEDNLPEIRAALTKGGNKNFEIVKLHDLNHLFHTAKTGMPNEYGAIEETFSPKALQIMGDWVVKVTQAR